jgi:hypothetical protein
MLPSSLRLKIEPHGDEIEEEFEDFNRRLRDELNEISGVSDASFAISEEKAPERTRAGDLVPLGDLAMTFLSTGGISASLGIINTFLGNRKKKIKIDTKNGTFEGENLSSKDVDKI